LTKEKSPVIGEGQKCPSFVLNQHPKNKTNQIQKNDPSLPLEKNAKCRSRGGFMCWGGGVNHNPGGRVTK